MTEDQIVLVAGIVVVVLILRAISTRRVGGPSVFHQGPSSVRPKSSRISSSSISMEGVDGEVLELIHGNKIIEAIKLVREKHGIGLKEAKDYVEILRKGEPGDVPQKVGFKDVSDLRNEVMRLVREGKKIEAIKLVQDSTRMGLKQAKDLVEKMDETLK